jgi:hypothetical protein
VDVIRCQMCQTENEVGAEYCRLCHARLPEAPVGPPSDDEGEAVSDSGQMPEWLSRLRQEVSGETPSSPPPEKPPADDGLEWLGEMPEVVGEEEGPPPGEVPEWVGEAPPSPAEGDVPEWLARIRAKAKGSEEAPEAEAFPQSAVEPETPETREEAPAPRPAPPAPEMAAPLEPEQPGSLGLPEWLMGAAPREEAPAAPSEPDRPAWLEGMTSDDSQEMPRVPALVFDSEEPGAPADIDLTDISSAIPDWMAEAGPGESKPDRPDLAPATLPAWLEAMRPVDTFRSVVEFDSTEDQAVEAAGPLAGLRGVLLAEPVVAMPRSPSGETTRLDVNEKQYAQAELLHRLVEEERQEARPRPAGRRRPGVLRWVIGASLLVAVGLPAILGFPSFDLPAFAPVDLASLVGLVETVPAESRALVVFDYEPGMTGEMEAVAGPLVSHLMERGVLLATLSTRPGGPALAERLMARVGATHNYVRGEDFVHLGYLPGGPAAVELFATAPEAAVPAGYLQDPEAGSVWQSPVLSGVQALSDFALLVVITSGSDDARVWIEQAQPHLGGKPLVAVVSAGAEPLVRPYYESTEPKVAGMLSGLTSATAYEQRLGRPALAHSRWSSYGLGLLAVEVLIALGAFGGLTSLALRLRR